MLLLCRSSAGAVCAFLGKSAGVQRALVQLSAATGCRVSERSGGLAGTVGLQEAWDVVLNSVLFRVTSSVGLQVSYP